ncbi:aldo/keto reductase [Chondrinema litorale]|uniref:aldo/keto reductase n=1 Tax=Chondrinema litorale TaxID=2994555 RepID=UPI002542CD5A|nr:aldo/keto reductase [Chondrinema litorale]UZR96666.1 aldo/keto reductase [Chondrinema litorale]
MNNQFQLPSYQPDIYKVPSIFNKGSRLVFGTSGIGGVWGKVNEEESIDCLLYAFENGITTVDSAPSYSRSEEFVGKALKRWKGELPFISTKIGRLPAEKADECYVDYSTKSLKDSLKRSLDKLGVEKIDLLFLHEPHLVPIEEIDRILDTLKSFVEEGYVSMLGVGGNPTEEFRPYVVKENFQAVSGFLKMDACNLSAFEKDIPQFEKEGIVYYAASALHMALLGNKFEEYVKNPPNTEWITMQNVKVADAVNKLAAKNDMSLPTLAQRYLFSIKEAGRISIGASNLTQIKSTVADWQQGALPKELFDEITQLILSESKNI